MCTLMCIIIIIIIIIIIVIVIIKKTVEVDYWDASPVGTPLYGLYRYYHICSPVGGGGSPI